MLSKKSEIVFIGAGKVAHTLIPLLLKNNYSVKGIISRHKKSASSAGRKFGLDYYSSDYSSITAREGIFFLTLPDSQISTAASKLASLNLDFRKSLFIHTSGSESISALKALQKKGGITASFHIMQTFPSLRQSEIANAYAGIETKSSKAERFLSSLARTLKLKPFILTEEEKIFYHMAGVFTSNFLNADFFSAEKLLNNTGIEEEKHYQLFEPIIKTTLSNIEKNGVGESISGPVQRGDYLTIQRHIDAIKKLKSKKKKLFLHSYLSQSAILIEIIKNTNGELTAAQIKVKKILEAELKRL